MNVGHIIYLNGTSSAGKSSIAAALQTTLPAAYHHFSLDRFNGMYPPRYVAVLPFDAPAPPFAREGMVLRHESRDGVLRLETHFGPVARRFVTGMRHTIRALATTGNNVIVDDVLYGREFIAECVTVLAGVPVTFVEVHCPVPEVARRERARGDRLLGLAAWQLPQIRASAEYDLTVDTARHTPEECAGQIARFIADTPSPGAFEHMRERLG